VKGREEEGEKEGGEKGKTERDPGGYGW